MALEAIDSIEILQDEKCLNSQNSKERDFRIDALKGFVMLWIVWCHTFFIESFHGQVHNAVFFFLSGIFFKFQPWRIFLSKKIRTLVIPFLGFFFLSYPFWITLYFWDYRTFVGFDWNCWECLFFKTNEIFMYAMNGPLWFLMCLIVMQLTYNIFQYLPRKVILLMMIILMMLRPILDEWHTYFYFNKALIWLPVFVFGHMFGKELCSKLKDTDQRTILTSTLITVSLVFILVRLFIPNADDIGIIPETSYIIYSATLVALFSYLTPKIKFVKFLQFIGVNSLVVLGCHIWLIIPLNRLGMKLYENPSPFLGFLNMIVCIAILIPVILIVNKYIPELVGKKRNKSENKYDNLVVNA